MSNIHSNFLSSGSVTERVLNNLDPFTQNQFSTPKKPKCSKSTSKSTPYATRISVSPRNPSNHDLNLSDFRRRTPDRLEPGLEFTSLVSLTSNSSYIVGLQFVDLLSSISYTTTHICSKTNTVFDVFHTTLCVVCRYCN